MSSSRGAVPSLPQLAFKNREAWAAWLERHHRTSPGLWLRLAKKGSATPSLNYAEAVEIALCYGWIDGQKQKSDDKFWLQKFSPRGPRSLWSKINREKAQRLLKQGLIQSAGLAAIEQAKAHGRWEGAYDSSSRAEVPADLAAALDKNAKAKKFFAVLEPRNRYAILFRLQTAKKPETRQKRLALILEMLLVGKKFHP